MLFAGLLLSGCGTVTPKKLMPDDPKYDASTPKQYDPLNSGIIGFVTGDHDVTTGAIVTKNFYEKYNNLIKSYALQFYNSEKIQLKANDGIEYYQDIYKNNLYIIDSEHLVYHLKMNRWANEGKEDDSLWMKAKNSFLP